ncbi:hypothetical protein VYU27_004913 [Nannochloropsis oceanica]
MHDIEIPSSPPPFSPPRRSVSGSSSLSSSPSTQPFPVSSSLLPLLPSPLVISLPPSNSSRDHTVEIDNNNNDQHALHEVEDGFVRQLDALERFRPSLCSRPSSPDFTRRAIPLPVGEADAYHRSRHAARARQALRTALAKGGEHGQEHQQHVSQADEEKHEQHGEIALFLACGRRGLHSLRLHAAQASTRRHRLLCLDGYAQSTAARRCLRRWRLVFVQQSRLNVYAAWHQVKGKQLVIRWWRTVEVQGPGVQREGQAVAATRHALRLMFLCWKRWKAWHFQRRQQWQQQMMKKGLSVDVDKWREGRGRLRALALLLVGVRHQRRMQRGEDWRKVRLALKGWTSFLHVCTKRSAVKESLARVVEVGEMARLVGKSEKALQQWRERTRRRVGGVVRLEVGETRWRERRLSQAWEGWKGWARWQGRQERGWGEGRVWWYALRMSQGFYAWRDWMRRRREGRREEGRLLLRWGWRMWKVREEQRREEEEESAAFIAARCQQTRRRALRRWLSLVKERMERWEIEDQGLALQQEKCLRRCLDVWAKMTMISMRQRGREKVGVAAWKGQQKRGWVAFQKMMHRKEWNRRNDVQARWLWLQQRQALTLVRWVYWTRGQKSRKRREREGGKEGLWQWKGWREGWAFKRWRIWVHRHRKKRQQRALTEAEERRLKLLQSAYPTWHISGGNSNGRSCTALFEGRRDRGEIGEGGRRHFPTPRPWNGDGAGWNAYGTGGRGHLALSGGNKNRSSSSHSYRAFLSVSAASVSPPASTRERTLLSSSSLPTATPSSFDSSSSFSRSLPILPPSQRGSLRPPPRRPLEVVLEAQGVQVPAWILREMHSHVVNEKQEVKEVESVAMARESGRMTSTAEVVESTAAPAAAALAGGRQAMVASLATETVEEKEGKWLNGAGRVTRGREGGASLISSSSRSPGTGMLPSFFTPSFSSSFSPPTSPHGLSAHASPLASSSSFNRSSFPGLTDITTYATSTAAPATGTDVCGSYYNAGTRRAPPRRGRDEDREGSGERGGRMKEMEMRKEEGDEGKHKHEKEVDLGNDDGIDGQQQKEDKDVEEREEEEQNVLKEEGVVEEKEEEEDLGILEARLRGWMMERERFEQARVEVEELEAIQQQRRHHPGQQKKEQASTESSSLSLSTSQASSALSQATPSSPNRSSSSSTSVGSLRRRQQEERLQELREVLREYEEWQERTLPLIRGVHRKIGQLKLRVSGARLTTTTTASI